MNRELLWPDEEKFHVNFEITAWGKTHEFRGTYDNAVGWSEILNDVVKVLQSSYGYAFDVERNLEDIGIYCPEKPSDE